MEIVIIYERLNRYLIRDILKITLEYLYKDAIIITENNISKDIFQCRLCNRINNSMKGNRCTECKSLFCERCIDTSYEKKDMCKKCKDADDSARSYFGWY
jgi:hypothetical protein